MSHSLRPHRLAHQCHEENKIRWYYSQWWRTEDILAQVSWASQVGLVVKNRLPMQQTLRDVGLIPGSGRSPGEGNGNPLQDSCLENPKDRGVWQVTIHRVTKSQTLWEQLSTEGGISLRKGNISWEQNWTQKLCVYIPSGINIKDVPVGILRVCSQRWRRQQGLRLSKSGRARRDEGWDMSR